jgi:hypothetical protein
MKSSQLLRWRWQRFLFGLFYRKFVVSQCGNRTAFWL